MKATSKQEFFELLEHELNRIGIEDTNDIFADFEEHFTDGAMRGIPEGETAERLGDIKEIARSYLNLESSRINSIMARDVERRRVSLTKPGQSVPADLSLIEEGSAKDAQNSDNIREYTPEHFSSEIYPQPQSGTPNYDFGSSVPGASGTQGASSGTSGTFSGAEGTSCAAGGSSASAGTSANTNSTASGSGTGAKSVADAFTDAGKAALDAAKLTGQVVADAFKQRGAEVKDAMKNAEKSAAEAIKAAGQSAADAVKSAGQSAADAMRGAKTKKRKQSAYEGAPRPSDTYRENMSAAGGSGGISGAASRAAEMPRDFVKGKSGYKVISVSDLKPNVNAGKLILAILLDVFVWSWLVPMIIGLFIALAGSALSAAGEAFRAVFSGYAYVQYHFISRIFLTLGFTSLAILLVNLAVLAVKLIIRLIKFIINLHIKAIYDL